MRYAFSGLGVTLETLTGTRPRLEFRDIDYQLVIKSSVETQPKKSRRFHTVVKKAYDYQRVTY